MGIQESNYFHNRVFAISGGGSGIGFETVKQLLSLGARVSIADYRLGEDLATRLGGKDENLFLKQVDVTSAKQVEEWIQETVTRWGRLDGAANLAGTVPKDHNYGTILTTEDDDWTRTLAVNIDGTKNCVREEVKFIGKGYLKEFQGEQIAVGKGNPKAEGGSIVNTGSTLSVVGSAGTAAYTASKHAVLGLTRCVAKEIGPQGTRVNCLCPGPTATPLLAVVGEREKAAGKTSDEGYGNLSLRRIGDPEELADTFIYLLSDKSTFITGATICVDGGLVL